MQTYSIEVAKTNKTGFSPKPIVYYIDDNECHICISHGKQTFGYPQICINKKFITIYKYLFEKKFGEVKKGLVLRHKCDNPACINPEHLEIGTQKDNMMDRASRGRNKDQKGEKNGSAKLTTKQVIEIRESPMSLLKLGKLYEVSAATIWTIKNNIHWNHI